MRHYKLTNSSDHNDLNIEGDLNLSLYNSTKACPKERNSQSLASLNYKCDCKKHDKTEKKLVYH